jgi:hypothetical protein
MKPFLVLSIITCTLLAGCVQQASNNNNADTTHTPAAPVKNKKPDFAGGPVIGERINGPANIRNAANGEVIFSLEDTTLVTCTEGNSGWYQVGLTADLSDDAGAFGTDTLRKGRDIIVDGKVVGKVLKDIPVNTGTNTKRTWAELVGYTYKNNLYPQTIIENVLPAYLDSVHDRSLKSMQPFISSFKLQKNDLLPFATYLNYESWIDDPSPLMRIQLVFFKDQLIGVVHSRQMELRHAANTPLERGFKVAFFDDTPKDIRKKFTDAFNTFIVGVD